MGIFGYRANVKRNVIKSDSEGGIDIMGVNSAEGRAFVSKKDKTVKDMYRYVPPVRVVEELESMGGVAMVDERIVQSKSGGMRRDERGVMNAGGRTKSGSGSGKSVTVRRGCSSCGGKRRRG